MKKICSIFILFMVSVLAEAQQKYGHIDSYEVVGDMPEFKRLNANLKAKERQLEAQINNSYKKLSVLSTDVQLLGAGLMTAILEEKVKEGAELEEKIAQLQENGPYEIEAYKNKMFSPINVKYLKAVNEVCKEQGFTYIFDLSKGGVVYFPEDGGDVSLLVKRKLGL